MSRRGRPPKAEETVQRYAYIPITLASQVDLLLTDPMTNKPKYGAWSELINSLLSRWLEEKKELIRKQGGINAAQGIVSPAGGGNAVEGNQSEGENDTGEGKGSGGRNSRLQVPPDPGD